MSPNQKKFLTQISETRKLHPEILEAIEVLSQQELTPQELEDLVVALSRAPLQDDAEFVVKGIIKG